MIISPICQIISVRLFIPIVGGFELTPLLLLQRHLRHIPGMSALHLDTDGNYITITAPDQTDDESSYTPESSTQARKQPCGHVKLSRSLSKSDSDLLVSSEEYVTLGKKSLAKGRTEGTQIDHLSSLTTDWEQVSTLGFRGNKTKDYERAKEVGVKSE